MALLAASADEFGAARVFFDLRPVAATREEQSRIASAIERALANAKLSAGPDLRLS